MIVKSAGWELTVRFAAVAVLLSWGCWSVVSSCDWIILSRWADRFCRLVSGLKRLDPDWWDFRYAGVWGGSTARLAGIWVVAGGWWMFLDLVAHVLDWRSYMPTESRFDGRVVVLLRYCWISWFFCDDVIK